MTVARRSYPASTIQPLRPSTPASGCGLRRVVLKHGVASENSPMTRLERNAPAVVHTAQGSITAERVVLAMNAWSLGVPELRSAILVIASDDAVTAPVPELLEKAGYKTKALMGDSQLFVTGFRTTAITG